MEEPDRVGSDFCRVLVPTALTDCSVQPNDLPQRRSTRRYPAMQIGVITNPNSRQNKKQRDRATKLQSIVGGYGAVHETPSPNAIKLVVRQFLRDEVNIWVADGGDGTLHWMLRTALDVLDEPEFAFKNKRLPLVMPTNDGSVNVVARNVGIRSSAPQLLCKLCRQFDIGKAPETVAVDSMLIGGVQLREGREEDFRTIGFAVAVGGIGQRFCRKYYEAPDPGPAEIVRVIARAVSSYSMSHSPLCKLLNEDFLSYANIFRQTNARVIVDGNLFPRTDMTGIHVASISIDLGGVLRFFRYADVPGQLHAIYGAPHPIAIIRNLPRMCLGKQIICDSLIDGPCHSMSVEAIGGELLAPVIDGEFYENVKRVWLKIGPRVRVAKVDAKRDFLSSLVRTRWQ